MNNIETAKDLIRSRNIDFSNGNQKAIVSIDFIAKLMVDFKEGMEVNEALNHHRLL